jgi:hypothetical protein
MIRPIAHLSGPMTNICGKSEPPFLTGNLPPFACVMFLFEGFLCGLCRSHFLKSLPKRSAVSEDTKLFEIKQVFGQQLSPLVGEYHVWQPA